MNDENGNNHLYLQPKPLPQRRSRRSKKNDEPKLEKEEVSYSTKLKQSSGSSIIEVPSDSVHGTIHYITEKNFEFLDHTADILVHANGTDIGSVIANSILGMNKYMVEHPENIELTHSCEIVASGHDLISLCYNIMDAALYRFVGDNFIAGGIKVQSILLPSFDNADDVSSKNDEQQFNIHLLLYGEEYIPLGKHGQGTEVKAITYSGMRINEGEKSNIIDESSSG